MSGQLKGEVNMENGLPNGVTKSYYENGQLNIEGNVKTGKAYGLHKVYYENGSLKHEENWKDGEKDGWFKTNWVTIYNFPFLFQFPVFPYLKPSIS